MTQEKISLMRRFSPRPITERLREKYAFYHDEHKWFWAFTKKHGVWKENAEEIIERVLRNQMLGDEMSRRFYINEVVADVRIGRVADANVTEDDVVASPQVEERALHA